MDKSALLASISTADDRALMANLLDKADQRTMRNIPTASRFLTEAEQTQAADLLSRAGETVLFDGGFPDAERKIAVFLPDYLENAQDSGMTPILLRSTADKFHETPLSHRDYLGALMAMGIERDTVGDILIDGRECYLALTEAASELVLAELTSVGRCTVTVERVEGNVIDLPKHKVVRFSDTVASLRLDAVVAAAFNLSREGAASAIRTGKVQLGGKEAIKPDREVKVGDKIALRGGGKVRIADLPGMSKKGRVRVEFEKYV